MKVSEANTIRATYLKKIEEMLTNEGEDIGKIASNAINIMATTSEGEECMVEFYVKIPKDSEDSLAKRREYLDKVAAAEETAKKREKERAEKEAKAKARKEAKEKKAE